MSATEPLSVYDLRLRSLDRLPGEPINLCSMCGNPAHWSVWLHTPEWGSQGGVTLVLCTVDALDQLADVTHEVTRYRAVDKGSPDHEPTSQKRNSGA